VSSVVYVGYVCRNAVKASDQTVKAIPWRLFDQSYEHTKSSELNAGRSCDVCCVENSEKTNRNISAASQETDPHVVEPQIALLGLRETATAPYRKPAESRRTA